MKSYQRGFIGTTVVVIIGALLVIGLGVWWYMNTVNSTSSGSVPTTQDTANTDTHTMTNDTASNSTHTLPGGLIVQDVKVGS